MKKIVIIYCLVYGMVELVSFGINSPYIPSLTEVLIKLGEIVAQGDIWIDIGFSLFSIVVGYFISVIIACILVLLANYFKTAKKAISQIADFLRSIAAVALAPLFITVLGVGVESRIVLMVWSAWPPIFLSTLTAIGMIDKHIVEAARLDGATKMQILRFIQLPVMAPEVLTGMRISMGTVMIGLVAAEMMASNKGIGFYILVKAQSFEIQSMYAGIIIMDLMGFCLNRALLLIQRRIVL